MAKANGRWRVTLHDRFLGLNSQAGSVLPNNKQLHPIGFANWLESGCKRI